MLKNIVFHKKGKNQMFTVFFLSSICLHFHTGDFKMKVYTASRRSVMWIPFKQN